MQTDFILSTVYQVATLFVRLSTFSKLYAIVWGSTSCPLSALLRLCTCACICSGMSTYSCAYDEKPRASTLNLARSKLVFLHNYICSCKDKCCLLAYCCLLVIGHDDHSMSFDMSISNRTHSNTSLRSELPSRMV